MEQLNSIENTGKLSFDIMSFNAENFNVERFLDRTRHTSSLDDIHKDLRRFLQDIQSSMVNLINDDYTDFVKLSTSLHALNDAKQSLSTCYETSWHDYEKTTAETKKLVTSVTQKLNEINKSRHLQFKHSLQLSRATCLKNLLNDLQNMPKFADLVWLNRIREHVSLLKSILTISQDIESTEVIIKYSSIICSDVKKYLLPYMEFKNISSLKAKSIILDILIDVNGVNDATEFVTKTICPVSNLDGKADVRLEEWITCINNKHKEIKKALDESELSKKSSQRLEKFYENCLLLSLIQVFKENIRLYLLPINPQIFRKCFDLMNNFINNFPNHQLYTSHWKNWYDSFQISAYIRYHTLDATNKFRDSLDVETLKLNDDEGDKTFETSIAFLEIVNILFDENVILNNTRSLFWDEVYKRFIEYLEWIESVKNYLISCPDILPSGTEKWLALIVAGQSFYKTLKKFQELGRNFFKITATTIDPAQVNLMSSNFDNCISYAEEQIQRHCDMIEICLNTTIFDQISKDIVGVSEVPKVYRWTKHPAPTGQSPYASKMGEFLQQIEKISIECGWSETVIKEVENAALERCLKIFHLKASEVLDSVEQIGSSLLKLKKKQTTTQDGSNLETDESKMKKQIAYDTKYFLNLIELSQADIFKEINEALQTLLTRAEIYDV